MTEKAAADDDADDDDSHLHHHCRNLEKAEKIHRSFICAMHHFWCEVCACFPTADDDGASAGRG